MHETAEPTETLTRLNRFLNARNEGAYDTDSIVAASVAIVDMGESTVRFASAGAERPVILGLDRQPRIADTTGLPLGAFAHSQYEPIQMSFDHGETIVMATDGITEARRGKTFLSYEGMITMADKYLGHGLSLHAEGQAVLDAARAFAHGKFQDDVCLLLARNEA